MKIRTQLILGFSIIILLTCSVFTYNFTNARQDTTLIKTIKDQIGDSHHAESIKFNLSGHLSDQSDFLLTNKVEFLDDSKSKLEQLDKDIKAITVNDLGQSEKTNYTIINKKIKEYQKLSNQFNQLVEVGKLGEAKSLQLNEITNLNKDLTLNVDKFIKSLTNNDKKMIDTFVQKTNSTQLKSMYLLGALVIFSILLVIYLINRINKPLNKLIDVSKAIANGDFTVQLETSRRDELGLLAKAFDAMKESVREVIASIMDASTKVASSSQELTASAAENTMVAQKITDTAITLAEKGNDQQDIIGETITSVNQTIASLEQMKSDSEMMYTITDETYHSTSIGAKMIGSIVEDTKSLEKQIVETVEITDTLAKLSDEIEQIIFLIQEFAEQTKLLSFNASIEAARAGEYGKGFAVVAQEIKLLSDQSKENAQKVTLLVNQIQKQTSICAEGMQGSFKQVEQNLKTIVNAQTNFEKIKENALASKRKVENVTSNIASIFRNAEKLLTATEDLDDIAQELGGLSQENSAASEEQLASLEQIAASSQQLSQIAEELELETQRFKI